MKTEDSDSTTMSAARSAFAGNLRRALHHLYDPVELRKSPLLPLFGLDPSTGIAPLRQILESAIESLKPAVTVSAQADAWRTYRTLNHRFIEQFSQASVSANLGLSVRQLRRQERLALQTLADWLIQRYGLNLDELSLSEADAISAEGMDSGDEVDLTPAPPLPGSRAPNEDAIEQELKWIEQSFPSGQIAVAAAVTAALQTVKPLMTASTVSCECDLPDGLPHLQAQSVTVRQVLLNILTAAIRTVPGGTVRVMAGYQPPDPHVWLNIEPRAAGEPHIDPHIDPHCGPHTMPAGENLRIARDLVNLCGGSLEMGAEAPGVPFTARLLLPAVEQVPVLVIDDNTDTLQLVHRCLSNSRYQCVGAHDPAQVQGLMEQYQPRAILLDVMLPSIDGWDLLGRLRENPGTAGIPVIICTILPQEELALQLGAAAFLRKPVTRELLLQKLDQQTLNQRTSLTTTPPVQPRARAPD
jgi:CheY-like chemotaxis protein